MNTYSILELVIAATVIISNALVIVVIVKSRQLHLPTLWNIVVMAACDVLNGLYFLVFVVPSLMLGQFAYPDYMMRPASVMLAIIFGQNNLNILLSLIDRYIAVCWPLDYLRLMSKKRFALAISCMHVITLIRLALISSSKEAVQFRVPIGVCMVDYETLWSRIASVGFTFLSFIIIVILLVRISLELKRSRRKVAPVSSKGTNTTFTFTMCLSSAVFILCYLPSCVVFIWAFILVEHTVPSLFLQAALTLYLSNSLWNVVIYASTYKPFRDAFLRLFCTRLSRERARRDMQAAYKETKIFAIAKN